jgi:hypothetical protein
MAGTDQKPDQDAPAAPAEVRRLADDARKDMSNAQARATALRREEADLERQANQVRDQRGAVRREWREADTRAKELATRAKELQEHAGRADKSAADKRAQAAELEREAEQIEDKNPAGAADRMEEVRMLRETAEGLEAEQTQILEEADKASGEAKILEQKAGALLETTKQLSDRRDDLLKQSELKEQEAEQAEADVKIYGESVQQLEGQAVQAEIRERGEQLLKEAETGPTSMAPTEPVELTTDAEAVAASVLAEVSADEMGAPEPLLAEQEVALTGLEVEDPGIEASGEGVEAMPELDDTTMDVEPDGELADAEVALAEPAADLVEAEPETDPMAEASMPEVPDVPEPVEDFGDVDV